ncbi:uncharacterized protein EDB91DRAFT_1081471 [Suillus paluster]|uniref:uncharacterized protein n=1 Tax=Suillus paluster TaxID=48578 RepID=UPI001B884730|nr:uncharacterized protein EDB91DRAFT_1081471 [Suillus paluster]KAG1742296.1 hypothetical protein EDB91DRAFT_1081471 [Suillus paluster]
MKKRIKANARGGTRGRARGQSHGRGRVNPSLQVKVSKTVSRSSGLEKGGTRSSLKDFKVQEQYRVFVGEKLRKFGAEKQTKDGQENILILFLYETSLCLSSIFDSQVQTSSILSHLLPELYISASIQPPISSVLISLLHHLIAGYPSQKSYFEHLSRLSP